MGTAGFGSANKCASRADTAHGGFDGPLGREGGALQEKGSFAGAGSFGSEDLGQGGRR